MSIRTTQEDHGDTVPADLEFGEVVAKPPEDWREELARKVRARNNQQPVGDYGITTGADGKMQTTKRPA